MTMLNTKLLGLAMLAFLGLAATNAQAQGYAGDYPPNAPNLTPQQWSAAQQIFSEAGANLATLRQELAAKQAELNQLLSLPNPDTARIKALSGEIGQLGGQILAASAQARQQMVENGLPPDYFPMMGMGPCGPWNGPCWGGNGMMMGWQPYGGWRHHGHGGHGPRGGCWW